MTSRDLTENVEQLQIRQGLQLVRDRLVAALAAVGRRAAEYQSLPIAGRSHNVPAQITTVGKRFASVAEEMMVSFERIEDLLNRLPLRGIKGPVGTQQDMLDLLGGDAGKLETLEKNVARVARFQRGGLIRSDKFIPAAWILMSSRHSPKRPPVLPIWPEHCD